MCLFLLESRGGSGVYEQIPGRKGRLALRLFWENAKPYTPKPLTLPVRELALSKGKLFLPDPIKS